MDAPTTSRPLHCVIVTPERAVLDEVCDFIALPMFDGELGVLPGRLPVIGRLGLGELRTQRGARVQRYFIDGGFVQVKDNVVTVLTSKAIKGEEISIPAAQEALKAAQAPLANPELQEAHLKSQARARAQIRVAHHAQDRPELTLDGK